MHMCLRKKRKKLDDKDVKCIFTGYHLESKTHRFYDPLNKKMILSRDVEFLENQSWYGPANESLRTSSKVSIMDEKNVDEKQEEGEKFEGNSRQA